MTPILWYSNETPDRNGQGGQRRQFFQIAALIRDGHDVRVWTLAGKQDDTSVRSLAQVRRLALGAGTVHDLWEKSGIAASLLSRRWSGVVVAHSESWPVGRQLGVLARAPSFVDLHNVHSAWYRAGGALAVAEGFERLERDLLRHADTVSVCTPRDIDRLPVRRDGVVVIPHGIDETEWRSGPSAHPRPVVKLFGNWDWEPNRAGLEWFLTEAWPRIHACDPALSCEIAGGHRKWPPLPPGVAIAGRVPSVPDFVRDAAVIAVPVWGGVGAPLKYAESLASGVPVVATSEAAHGLDFAGGLVSNDPAQWAVWITDAVREPAAQREQAARIRDEVLRRHTWYVQSAPLRRWADRVTRRADDRTPGTHTER